MLEQGLKLDTTLVIGLYTDVWLCLHITAPLIYCWKGESTIKIQGRLQKRAIDSGLAEKRDVSIIDTGQIISNWSYPTGTQPILH